MTPEEKQLLLRDLCARLPYRVICQMEDELIISDSHFYDCNLSERYIELFRNHKDFYIKPYLRPMSSMTEEEMTEMHTMLSPTGTAVYKCDGLSTPVSHFGDFIPYEYMSRVIDWLNAHHFDYRGLIGEGLAIEVTEENNPYKD